MKNNKGFTLIELLVVIVMLVGISLIAVPSIVTSLNNKKARNLQEDKEIILRHIERYMNDNNSVHNCLKKNGGYIDLKKYAEKKDIKLKNKDVSSGELGIAILQNGELILTDSTTGHIECQISA